MPNLISVFRKSSHHNKVKPWDVPRKNYYYKYDLHDEAEDNDSWREEADLHSGSK